MNDIPRLRFSHVGLYVCDLARMEDFYSRALGFWLTDRGEINGRSVVFLTRDPDEHHQIVLVSGRPNDISFSVINQISFRLDSLDDLKTLYQVIVHEPISEATPITHGNAWSVYFRDPEGNRLELFVDTPWYVTQPFMLPIDLSRPTEELVRTTELACEKSPGFQPRQDWLSTMKLKMGQGGS